VPEALDLVRVSGRRPPDEWLPELLELASRSDVIRAAFADLGGPRAAWLVGAVPELEADPGIALGEDWEAAWDEATGAAGRASLVRSMRRADPAAAREAVARWLPDTAGDERARIVGALEEGLGPVDEPLLAAVGGDRRADVRRVATGLLVRLPGAALALRIEDRVRPLLARRGGRRASLAVTLPDAEPELEAAGFGGKPPAGIGERAWLLRQLLAHVRPSRWSEWLGDDPAALVVLAIRSEEARPVLEGWIEATTRFGDPAWASALLRDTGVREKVTLGVGQVFEGLAPDARATLLAEDGRSLDPTTLATFVTGVPAPWPGPLGETVLAVAGTLAANQYPDQAFYDLVRAASVGLPPDRLDALVTVASYNDEVRPVLVGRVETMHLRARIHDAFAALPAV
jgi:hypothetical protein